MNTKQKNENPQADGVKASIFSFEAAKKLRQESDVARRWASFYREQPHEDLLAALVYEHDNDFPMRRSADRFEQLRHTALIEVLQERAQTEFLREFLAELESGKVQ